MKFRLLSRSGLVGFAAFAALAFATPAFAMTTDEILNMVSVNVPVNIIIQTMDQSGTKFTADDIRALAAKGAPPEILAEARKLAAATSDAPAATPTTTKPAKAPDAFDDTTTLGGDKPKPATAAATASTSDSDQSDSPKQIDELIKLYRAKKVLTASKGFFDLLDQNTYPDNEAQIDYYLARCLLDLQMYDSSQHYFMQVVRKGPKNPYFKYALPKLVEIAESTGNDAELLRIVDKIAPEEFPKQGQDELYYLMCRKLYDQESLSEAYKYCDQVSAKSNLYMRARYFMGEIDNQKGKLKSAVKEFKAVYESEAPAGDAHQAQAMNDLKDLSLINIARIYYGLGRHDTADTFYQDVDRDSQYWPESLFERGWNKFLESDYDQTLGLLLTVRSPYYNTEEYIPEADVLRALTFFSLCEYGDVEKILKNFESTYKPQHDEMKAFLDQYGTDEGKKLSDQAFDEYFGNGKKDTTLTKPLFTTMLRNRELSALVDQLDEMDNEDKLIDAQKSAWKDTVGVQLKKVLDEDRQRYKRKAGTVLLNEMATQYHNLGDLLQQSQIIRFEVVDAQRADYEFKSQSQTANQVDNIPIDFSTSRDIIYWPFNGEFWQDELGYYRYTEKSACHK